MNSSKSMPTSKMKKQIDEFFKTSELFLCFRFNVYHVLSQEPSWNGLQGRISKDLISSLMSDREVRGFFCICGPSEFNQVTIK
jgi:hypothetical protein